MKTLVLYIFHEYNERVEYYIKNAIFYDKDVDFIVISNNEHLEITVPEYVKLFKRQNIGYDFGGWSDALLHNNLYKNYEAFIFANSSVIGPFVNKDSKWTDIYLEGLTDDVKLFGSTINTQWYGEWSPQNISIEEQPLYNSHVQSYIFSMTLETLEYLITQEIFSVTNIANTYQDAITKEVQMSRKILHNNWNIGSLMKLYAGVDFRFIDKKPADYKNIAFQGDLMYEPHLNKIFTLEEVVFIKGNRIKNANIYKN